MEFFFRYGRNIMVMSNAERQKRYRKSRKGGVKNELQLKVWLNISELNALARLARHHGITQKAMLEQLIRKAESQTLEGIQPESGDWNNYWGEHRYDHNEI